MRGWERVCENVSGWKGVARRKKVGSHLAYPAAERWFQFFYLDLQGLQRLGGGCWADLRATIRCSNAPQPPKYAVPKPWGKHFFLPSHLAHPAIPRGTQALGLQRVGTPQLAHPVIPTGRYRAPTPSPSCDRPPRDFSVQGPTPSLPCDAPWGLGLSLPGPTKDSPKPAPKEEGRERGGEFKGREML